MDYNSIVQDLLAPGDIVVSAVECSWKESFRILVLVEHQNWSPAAAYSEKPIGSDEISPPESCEFLILVLDGRAPIRNKTDVDVINLIPVVSSSFSCEIDMETVNSTADVSIKISSDSREPQLLFRLARGYRSQNFIDEVFRAAHYASKQNLARSFPWLNYYEQLIMEKFTPTNIYQNSFLSVSNSAMTRSGSEGTISRKSEEDDEDAITGLRRDNLTKGFSSAHGREALIKNILDMKKDLYTNLVGYKVYLATWNVNGQSPGSICLSEWLARTIEPPDIYAVAFQELDLSKEAFLFNDSPREHEWLRSVRAGLHPGAKYKKVKLIRLVGMMLIVFVKETLVKSLLNVCGEYVGTGILGKMGNKGAVAVRFDIDETSLCFVNCHLAAHVEEYQRRNQDYRQILSRLNFDMAQYGLGTKYIKDHDQIFWFGDMNYRINQAEMDPDTAKAFIDREKYAEVLYYDQLKDQMRMLEVFQGFTEGPITFRPTYKYDVGKDTWDSSEKHRSPAWCDRVLWKGNNLTQVDYTSHSQYKLSDHKPVSSLFEAEINVINPDKYRRHYEEALKWLDKEENKCLPHVAIDIPGSANLPHSNRNEIHFGTIRFFEPIGKCFSVRNVGQFAVRLEFIKKLNDTQVCKDWLTIEPLSAFIPPGQSCEIKIQVFVDKKSAGQLNIGKDTLYDILVMHLDGGKDIFVTVVGEFERSVFGCSIPALVNLTEPLRNISPGKLIELERGSLPMNAYDVPKELWFLVDRLYRVGMEKPLFRQSGLTEEILEIRNWLDEIPNVPIPGTVDSIAEVLLLLLESFPEPVVPFNLHLRCIDSSSNYSQAKQILKLMPLAHRNVFLYICSFLRELLIHSDKNGLDAKYLALLFGRSMLRDQNHNAKPNQKMERQKESFIYQFLVNDDYGEEL